MKRIWLACLLLLFGVPALAQKAERRTLDIYYIDVEGGAATLIVTPAGESILVDAGWPGFDGRDANRIRRAMQQAGATQIDHLIATHYHTDHYGGIPALAKLVPVKQFYDHGPIPSLAEDKNFPQMYAAYHEAAQGRTVALKPGDTIPLRRAPGTPPLSLRCLAAKAEVVAEKKMAGAPNPACAAAAKQDDDPSDNARSVVLLLKFGDFDFFDAGDLTWNVEQRLVCPANLIGEVDLYQVTHHGANNSNNPVLLRSVRPTAAIMNNGPRKGGHPDTVKWLRELPTLKGLYQVHRNVASKPEENAPPEFIANLEEQPDEGQMITVSVDAARRVFTVTNERTAASKTYSIR